MRASDKWGMAMMAVFLVLVAVDNAYVTLAASAAALVVGFAAVFRKSIGLGRAIAVGTTIVLAMAFTLYGVINLMK